MPTRVGAHLTDGFRSSLGSGAAGSSADATIAPSVVFVTPLRPQAPAPREVRRHEDEECFGGLRNVVKVVRRLPKHEQFGRILSKVFDGYLRDFPQVKAAIVSAVSTDDKPSAFIGPDLPDLDECRRRLAKTLGGNPDTRPCVSSTCSTSIRGHLLHRWAEVVEDPARQVCAWCWEGAPAGIVLDPVLEGVFPRAQHAGLLTANPEELLTDLDAFTNFSSFENDDESVNEVLKYRDKGYLLEFNSQEELRAYLGAEPIVSKFAVLWKWRDGAWKKRVILDLKASSVTACTRATHRVVLPRVSDAVQDVLELLWDQAPGEGIEWAVLDFTDAFWNIPLAFSERKHFVGMARGKFYVFARAAQGSRNGPLAWAAVISVVMRLSQSLFAAPLGDATRRSPEDVRMQLYVDDPAIALRGSDEVRDHNIAKLALCWLVLGLPLAFAKARRGRSVPWIGCQLSIKTDFVEVTILASKVDDLRRVTQALLHVNVIAIKALRSYIGTVNHFATILFTWRPFLSELWGALGSILHPTDGQASSSRAPRNCVWQRQVASALSWIDAFLQGVVGDINRRFHISAYRRDGSAVRIVSDASPWGIGAYLQVEGAMVSWFSCAVDQHAQDYLKIVVGSSEAQQTLEALAILVALRLWKQSWALVRSTLEVRADNVSALTAVACMRAKGYGVNLVAREMALDLSDGCYRPDICTHTPGVASSIADGLSRRFQPGVTFVLPAALAQVPQAHPEPVTSAWFRCRSTAVAAAAQVAQVGAAQLWQ